MWSKSIVEISIAKSTYPIPFENDTSFSMSVTPEFSMSCVIFGDSLYGVLRISEIATRGMLARAASVSSAC